MEALTPDQFQANIKVRTILYFPDEEYLNNPFKHYFICVGISSENKLLFSCCTSQFESVKRLIELNRFPENTLVYIDPSDHENPFSKPTFVNCNEYFSYSFSELWSFYLDGILIFPEPGILPLTSFEQILIGLNSSSQIEQEVKDLLPGIDDF